MDQKERLPVFRYAEIQNWVVNEIMDRMHANIYVTDLETREVLFMNQAMKAAFGLEHPEGKRCWELFQTGLTGPCESCPVNKLIVERPESSSYIREEKNAKNGRAYRNYDSLMRWPDGRLVHFQYAVDVTEERRLLREVSLDELTGAVSRRTGKRMLQEKLNDGRWFTLCMLDVNDLKLVNDTQGHQAGDALLVSVVEAVRRQLGPGDEIFRMSGDEFVVILEEVDRAGAVRRMRDAQLSLSANGDEKFCFGLAEAPQGIERTLDGILNEADADLYVRKRRRHINRAEDRLREDPQVTRDPTAFSYDERLLYNALVQSTDDYLYISNMKTGVFRYPQAMVDEFDLPDQVVANAAAVLGARVHEHDKAAFLESNQDIAEGRTQSHCVEYRVQNRRGEWVWMRCRGHLERDESGEPSLFAGFITNLDRKNQIDHLTGLANKIAFEAECRRMMETGALTLMFFGIDDLKRINSLYDRAFGDEVIRIVSQRIQSFLPSGAQVFRLDGDEFGVLIWGADQGRARSLFHAVQEAFSTQQTYGEKKFFCTLSCGCALHQTAKKGYQALLKRAACALEFAKRGGKDRLEFFAPEMMEHMERSLKLTELLRESIEGNFPGFQIHYQPVFNAERGLVGAEALCLWSCREYGAVSPEEFIGLLEDSGLILRAGRWIFQQAMSQCAQFLKRDPAFLISVNLSWLQLEDDGLIEFLSSTAEKYCVNPACVILELTETYLAAHLDRVSGLLEELRSLGFQIAMDDFGTGYSSLGLLKQAPIDVVKVDKTFVQGIWESAFDREFIRMAAGLCHLVGIRVCLEGVETEAEFETIRPLGLDFLQGFLLGRPCPPEEFISRFMPEHSAP